MTPTRMSVLCIDDEPGMLASLRRVFRREPYELITTADPSHALRLLDTRHIHLFMADQRMPTLSGAQLLGEAKSRSPLTRRVMLTAYPDTIGPDVPVDRLISKPWEDNDLRGIVAALLQHLPFENPGDLLHRLFRLSYMMMHNRESAEDIAQETMTRALTHIHMFRGEGELFSWAFTIALNLCRLQLRTNRSRPSTLDPARLDQLCHPQRDPLTTLLIRETHEKIAQQLRVLTPELREAFILHHVEGFPFSRVATICRISTVAARQRAHRACLQLKTSLEPSSNSPT